LGPGRLPALGVTLALLILAALRGGAAAGVAAVSFQSGLLHFLGFDHFERRLLHHPGARLRLAGPAWSETLRASLPGTLLLVGLRLGSPPRPHAGLDAATLDRLLDRDKMAPAYLQLAFVSLVGAAGVYYASRLLRRQRGGKERPVEMVVPERGRETVLKRERRG